MLIIQGHPVARQPNPEAARDARTSPVAPLQPSPGAKAKASSRRSPDGLPVQSLPSLLDHLATLTLNHVTLVDGPDASFPSSLTPPPFSDEPSNS